MILENELDYVRWQNRAFRFYVGARLLYLHHQFAPAAYCANQTLELILKATLVYWDKSFDPQSVGHGISKMLRILRNKVPNAKDFECPEYLWADGRYQSTSRYPSANGRGFGVPASFLQDIDSAFCRLLALTPFQHNTELKRALSGHDKEALSILRRDNTRIRSMRSLLGIKLET